MTKIDVVVTPPVGDDGEITTRGAPSFEDFQDRAADIADSIREIAKVMQERLGQHEVAPSASKWSMDTVSMSFQLVLQAGAGVIIAKASASATFSVGISWKQSK